MQDDQKPGIIATKVPPLEVFINPERKRNYEIDIEFPEFTSVCPRTGQPDFGTIHITYVPDKLCIELKSLKFYLQQYRNRGIFYEEVTNKILNDLIRTCSPQRMEVESIWRPRGGITTKVIVRYNRLQRKRNKQK
jgi:7-cyano-7-deazaguanine reductase